MTQRSRLKRTKRILVKVGTEVVTNADGFVSIARLGAIVERLCDMHRAGMEVLLVTSGAVGIGKRKLATQARLSRSIRDHMNYQNNDSGICSRAAAAAGQSNLMALYETLFGQYDIKCSQLLVTDEDFHRPHKQLAFHETCRILLSVGVIPIINENDVMSSRTDPIIQDSRIFWDNDTLACLVGADLEVDLVVLLTDVDGLLHEDSTVISSYFKHSTNFSYSSSSRVGKAGMQAKVSAAIRAVQSGVEAVVIGSGFNHDTLPKVLIGEEVGTLFSVTNLKVEAGEEGGRVESNLQ